MGGTATACLNAANERANELFRAEKLAFLGIPKVIEMVNQYCVISIHISKFCEDICAYIHSCICTNNVMR